MKDKIVFTLALGLIATILIVVIGDFWIALEENRAPDQSVVNLVETAIAGIVGIIAGYVVGKKSD